MEREGEYFFLSFYTLLSLLNLVCLWILAHKTMKVGIYLYMRCLAVSNFFLLALNSLYVAQSLSPNYFGKAWLLDYLKSCVQAWLLNSFIGISNLLLAAIAFERYTAITLPLKSLSMRNSRTPILICVFCWFLSLTMNFPVLFQKFVTKIQVETEIRNNLTVQIRTEFIYNLTGTDNHVFHAVFMIYPWYSEFLFHILPAICVLIITLLTLGYFTQALKEQSVLDSKERKLHTESNQLTIVLLILTVFLIVTVAVSFCIFLNQIYHFRNEDFFQMIMEYMLRFLECLTYGGNFFIYLINITRFKRLFLSKFSKKEDYNTTPEKQPIPKTANYKF